MMHRFCISVIVTAMLCVANISFASDENAKPASADKPVMVVLNVFPYGWREDGKLRGLFVEIAEKIRQRSNIDFKIALQPFGRNLKSLETGNADFSIFYSYPDTISGYRNLGNVSCTHLIAVPLAGRGIKTLEDLSGKSVLYPPGGYFDRHFAGPLKVRRIPVTAAESILALAARGRGDAFIASNQLLDAYMMKVSSVHLMPDDFWERLDTPIDLVEANIAFVISGKSRHANISDKISAVIREMQISGELAELNAKYSRKVRTDCFPAAQKNVLE